MNLIKADVTDELEIRDLRTVRVIAGKLCKLNFEIKLFKGSVFREMSEVWNEAIILIICFLVAQKSEYYRVIFRVSFDEWN